MSETGKLSQTMRIDLIPDIPGEAPASRKKRVIVTTPTRKHRRIDPDRKDDQPRSSYEELLQNIYDAALVTDLHGSIVDVNERAIEFMRYERAELCALTIFDIVHGSNESLIEDIWRNLEDERFTVIEAYCIRKDGSFFPSEIAVNKLHLESWHLCFFVRDITRRRQQEEMLRTEHNAIQNAGNGIAVANLEAKLEYVNPAVAAMLGVGDPGDLIGRDIRELLPDTANEMIDIVLNEKDTWTGEMAVSTDGRPPREVQVSAVRNRNSEGRTAGMVLSFVDISDRNRAEEAMRQAERHRVMLESLGAACHHLGQPATVLLANLGIIDKEVAEDKGTVKDLLRSSIEAAEKLGAILHKLNTVNEYKTTQYLERSEDPDAPENRILDI